MSETTRKINVLPSVSELITDRAELRRHLWTLIAEVKKTAHFVPNAQRADLLRVATEAEKYLT